MGKETTLDEKIQKKLIDVLRNKKGIISTSEIADAVGTPPNKVFVNLVFLYGNGTIWMNHHRNMIDWGLNDPCSECGNLVPQNAKFCPSCGKPQKS